MNEVLTRAEQSLRSLLSQVRTVTAAEIAVEERDTISLLFVSGITATQPFQLVCEVLSNGQPRYVSAALLRAEHRAPHVDDSVMTVPILIAPYFSPATRALCEKRHVGYVDLEGNARLQFGGVYIDRQITASPIAEKRSLKSLFKPRSAQVLHAMLNEPHRVWRVAELAEAADASLGHISNIRSALINREWAIAGRDGVRLTQPGALLDAWQQEYEAPAGTRSSFYSPLHGSSLDDAVRRALGSMSEAQGAALSSFSAARWLAPYARVSTMYMFATAEGRQYLEGELGLEEVTTGGNIVISVLKDSGILLGLTEPAPGAVCTSAIQTYLDLSIAGERGQEAALHLREEVLRWSI